jgi:Fe-S cluster assembly protein SufD
MNALQPAAQAGAARFLARYDAAKHRLRGDAAQREAAATAFRATGLPGAREEAWHYTSLRPMADISFAEPPAAPADCAELLARLPAIEAPRLVFVDGRFRAEHSAVPSHVSVRTGAPAFGTLARPAGEKLVALNTMLAEDGAAISVPEGMDAGTLLLISLATAPSDGPVGFHPRHSIHIQAGASLTLIEIAIGTGAYLHNPVFSVTVGEGARLVHLRLQDESPEAFHLSTLYADIAAHGVYDSFALTLGARLARMEVHARLAGAGAAAHLNAAQLLGGRQHADFTTVVRHDAPDTASRQTVKNVLTGQSRGVFQGKIEVARIAQKTDGYQMNQALLLSPEAEMDSKPQLEIFADDVKCSHGATVGELDADQLFYLRSRGVPDGEARTMLVRAFLSEALDPISHETARAAMEAAIAAWWDRQAP